MFRKITILKYDNVLKEQKISFLRTLLYFSRIRTFQNIALIFNFWHIFFEICPVYFLTYREKKKLLSREPRAAKWNESNRNDAITHRADLQVKRAPNLRGETNTTNNKRLNKNHATKEIYVRLQATFSLAEFTNLHSIYREIIHYYGQYFFGTEDTSSASVSFSNRPCAETIVWFWGEEKKKRERKERNHRASRNRLRHAIGLYYAQADYRTRARVFIADVD